MKVTFRTDASINIGNGHVMRCLTLASALKLDNAQCHFICRDIPGNLILQIRKKGFKVTSLTAEPVNAMSNNSTNATKSTKMEFLDIDWAADATQTISGTSSSKVDWLIVDHYNLNEEWEQALRPYCHNLMVIDDLANRNHDCNLLLDQNLGRQTHDYYRFVPQNCISLLGPNYALLRPEFLMWREYSLRRRENSKIKDILISMGGADPNNATGRILEALKICELPIALRVTIVMGPNAPWLSRVQNLALELPFSTEIKVNAGDMAEIMANSDLAIGAAGSSSWERCCVGLPSLVVLLADNQKIVAESLDGVGGIKFLGTIDEIHQTLDSAIRLLMEGDELQNMSKACASIIDGKGANRVKEAMLGKLGDYIE